MSSVSDLHKGLGQSLRAMKSLRVSDHIPEQINPPHAIVTLNDVRYHQQMASGMTEYSFYVIVAVGRMGERSAQLALDGYLSPDGPRSIRAALEADRTLGGVALDVTLVRASDIQPLNVGDASYLTIQFEATVRA
jgi:hypothetical protein